ncbi:MAG: S-layer homology domain-containing protein [Clostridia bacterium]|nr:S-layer homology domain-containing protein [Clostridia bacterium]
MRTLKKTLALVLVLAMALSFGVIGANAAFTDTAGTTYEDAIDVMTGLGVINGMTATTFEPAGNLTREQAAKIVTYIVLGPTNAQLVSSATSAIFDDVAADRWSAGYIEYCYNTGIIAGVGDNNFDPTGTLSSAAWTKMLLVALGYNASSEGFTGSSWAINVAAAAYEAGITDSSIAISASANATRGQACQMAFLALSKGYTVTYTGGTSMTVNGITITTGATRNISTTQTGMIKYFNASVMKGVVVANQATGSLYTEVKEVTLTNTKVTDIEDTATLFVADTALDLVGQVVNVYYYVNSVGKNVAYAVVQASTVVTVSKTISTAAAYKTAFGSVTMNDAAAVYNFTANYAAGAEAAAITGFTYGTDAATGTYAIYAGEIVSFVATPAVTFDKVTAIGTTSGAEYISFSALGLKQNNATSDVVNAYTGIAVGDYVTSTLAGTIYNLAPVTTVTGSVTALGTGSPALSVTLGGTKYLASAATGVAGLTEVFPSATADFTGNTYTLYLDSAGKFITCVLDTGTTTSGVVYAVGAAYAAYGDYGSVYKVQCVNSAGEEVIYTTASANDVDTALIAAGFYKVTVSAAGVASFDADLTGEAVQASAAVTLAKTSIINQANYYYASDVEFIFITGSGATLKVTSLTGLEAVAGFALTTDDMLYVGVTAATNKTINTVIVARAFTGATSAANVWFPNTTAAGVNAYGTVYTAFVNGVKTDVTVASVVGDTMVADRFATYTINTYGAYAISAFTSTTCGQAVAVNGVFGNYVTITGVGTYDASSAVVVDARASVLAGAPAQYTSLAALLADTGTYAFTVSYVLNTTGTVAYLYVTAATAP